MRNYRKISHVMKIKLLVRVKFSLFTYPKSIFESFHLFIINPRKKEKKEKLNYGEYCPDRMRHLTLANSVRL